LWVFGGFWLGVFGGGVGVFGSFFGGGGGGSLGFFFGGGVFRVFLGGGGGAGFFGVFWGGGVLCLFLGGGVVLFFFGVVLVWGGGWGGGVWFLVLLGGGVWFFLGGGGGVGFSVGLDINSPPPQHGHLTGGRAGAGPPQFFFFCEKKPHPFSPPPQSPTFLQFFCFPFLHWGFEKTFVYKIFP